MEIVNRVEKSGLVQVDLMDYYPSIDLMEISILDFLEEGVVFKEKFFRDIITDSDWSQIQGKDVLITNTHDVLVPKWAYMLLSATCNMADVNSMVIGDVRDLFINHFKANIDAVDFSSYDNKAVVVKGCGEAEVPNEIYNYYTSHLMCHAKSIMFGEPCSTVPIYKRKK